MKTNYRWLVLILLLALFVLHIQLTRLNYIQGYEAFVACLGYFSIAAIIDTMLPEYEPKSKPEKVNQEVTENTLQLNQI